jgi:hypothetical protein
MTQNTQTAPVSVLTDGTGVSPINATKLVKDFVADFLLTLAAGLGAGAGLELLDVGGVIAAPDVALIAVVGAFIRAGYRAVLRWATT